MPQIKQTKFIERELKFYLDKKNVIFFYILFTKTLKEKKECFMKFWLFIEKEKLF